MSCVVVTKLISIAKEVVAVINTNGCVCNSQTYEGPKQEGCQSEAQSAIGEKEECTVVGRSSQARGQYD